jgi:hypothetical protein
MHSLARVLAVGSIWLMAHSASAAILTLDLLGKAGPGLLSGNENGTITGVAGSGGEVGNGILFNDITLQLTINVAWGTANGFTNLTGTANGGHIHGPTTSGGTASFTQNAGVAIGLDSLAGWNPSASAGGFNGTVTLSAAQATDLLAGKMYINIHTGTNGNGEIRGNIVIPEPGSAALLALAGAMVVGTRRRGGERRAR